MKRIELYVKTNNRLSLAIFESLDSKYEKYILNGVEAYNYLEKLYQNKIVDIIEDANGTDLTLVYDNYIINLNEYERILYRKGLQPLVSKIKEYYENKQLIKLKNKKTTRKNKYSGKKIMAGGLVALIIGTGSFTLIKDQPFSNIQIVNAYSKESISENFEPQIGLVYEEFSKTNNSSKKEITIDIEPMNSNDEIIEQEEVQNNTTDQELSKIKDDTTFVSINYEDRSNTDKANIAQNNYGNLINKYATMYGIDPILVLAVATQESGIHSSVTAPGGATGLMQIQNEVWLGNNVSAYNFETQSNESFVVTLDKIQDLETNIKIGCMILQNSFRYMKYNTLASVQCYNMGYGNMMKILKSYSYDTNKTIDEILSNQYDTGWLDYRNIITCGDNKYIENVLSWIGEDINVKNVKPDGTLVHMKINNDFNAKKIY